MLTSVSYTHLDVYKRQILDSINNLKKELNNKEVDIEQLRSMVKQLMEKSMILGQTMYNTKANN